MLRIWSKPKRTKKACQEWRIAKMPTKYFMLSATGMRTSGWPKTSKTLLLLRGNPLARDASTRWITLAVSGPSSSSHRWTCNGHINTVWCPCIKSAQQRQKSLQIHCTTASNPILTTCIAENKARKLMVSIVKWYYRPYSDNSIKMAHDDPLASHTEKDLSGSAGFGDLRSPRVEIRRSRCGTYLYHTISLLPPTP